MAYEATPLQNSHKLKFFDFGKMIDSQRYKAMKGLTYAISGLLSGGSLFGAAKLPFLAMRNC